MRPGTPTGPGPGATPRAGAKVEGFDPPPGPVRARRYRSNGYRNTCRTHRKPFGSKVFGPDISASADASPAEVASFRAIRHDTVRSMSRIAKQQDRDLLTTRSKPQTATPFGGVRGTPKAPMGLLPATRAAWAQFWGMTELTRYLSDADVPSVDRLFELRDQAARMKRLIRKEGLTTDDGKAHPLISKVVTVEGAIGRLEDRLLLSPRARASAGVKFDAKRSADEYFESTLEDS